MLLENYSVKKKALQGEALVTCENDRSDLRMISLQDPRTYTTIAFELFIPKANEVPVTRSIQRCFTPFNYFFLAVAISPQTG